jgi:hypothetical protein
MSARTRRFDKYIPLFGKPGDNRVALFLGELEDQANELRNRDNRRDFVANDIQIRRVSPGFQNVYFQNKVPTLNDNDIHPDWTKFLRDLVLRLHQENKTNVTDPNLIDIIKELKGSTSKSGSVEQFITFVLSKIGRFSVPAPAPAGAGAMAAAAAAAVAVGREFVNNNSQLDNAIGIIYFNCYSIIRNLINGTMLGGGSGTLFPFLITDTLNLIRFSYDLTQVWPVAGAPPVAIATNTNNIPQLIRNVDPNVSTKITNYLNDNSPNGGAGLFANCNTAVPTIPTVALVNLWRGISKHLDTEREFLYKYDKYWLNRIFADAVETPMPATPSSFLTSEEVPADAGKYWRKADGSIWTVDANGKEINVGQNSDAMKALTHNNKCMGTGFEPHGTVTCADYLRDCLSGKDVTQCKQYLGDRNFWNNAQKEVEAMLPAIALRTLSSFEFDQVDVRDETAKMNLAKVIEVTEWLAKLAEITKTNPTKLSQAEYDNIARNDKLMGYLRLLVKKVNSNPSLLNKGIVKSDEQNLYRPNAFKGTRLARMGITPRLFAHNLGLGSIRRLAETVRESQKAFRIRLFGPQNMYGVLVGGGIIEEVEDRLSSENKQTWSVLKSHYDALVRQLQDRNKDIAPEDKKKIDELFDRLRQSEIKLTQVLLMAEKYKRLLDVHGEKDANTVLTVNGLKDFVDKRNRYFDRVSKRQNDLMSIVYSVAEQVNKVSPPVTITVSGAQGSSAVAANSDDESNKSLRTPINLKNLLG